MHSLFDKFLVSESTPEYDYQIEELTISHIKHSKFPIFIEIISNDSKTFSFKYKALVAWRDAGNAIQSHSWHDIHPNPSSYLDNLEKTKDLALIHAKNKGLIFHNKWISDKILDN